MLLQISTCERMFAKAFLPKSLEGQRIIILLTV
jgi:hypothetical protein